MSPEQSYPVLSVPPQRYGVPITPIAVTTISAVATGWAGTAPGPDGGAPPAGRPASASRIASSSAGLATGSRTASGGAGGAGGRGGGGGRGGVPPLPRFLS